MQILESMQENNKVLGGMIFHQNKFVFSYNEFTIVIFYLNLTIYYFFFYRIVVTQFGFELSKLIQLTNPFCNKVLNIFKFVFY